MSRGRRISRVKMTPPNKATAQKYLREWQNEALHHTPQDFPALTAQNLFDREGMLFLDIGCGTGEYLNALATASPDNLYFGVEISRRAIYYAVNQAAARQLDNIRYIKADFRLLYPLFAPGTLQEVYLIFPDPNYGGRKNRKNRIFSPAFLTLMATALLPGGTIKVVTDQEPFLYDMLNIAEADTRFEKPHAARFLQGFSPPEKTRFQMAWEKYNRPVFRFILTRKD